MNANLQCSDSHSHPAHAGSSLSSDEARILVLVGPPQDLLRPELSHEREAERQGNIWSQEVCLGAHVGHYLCSQTARLAQLWHCHPPWLPITASNGRRTAACYIQGIAFASTGRTYLCPADHHLVSHPGHLVGACIQQDGVLVDQLSSLLRLQSPARLSIPLLSK